MHWYIYPLRGSERSRESAFVLSLEWWTSSGGSFCSTPRACVVVLAAVASGSWQIDRAALHFSVCGHHMFYHLLSYH
jgi:NAD-dependent oxidoreductase involved in siderophore biosynthesis